MSKIIKILLSIIIVFSISILFQGTVHALDENGDGWDDPKEFHGSTVVQDVTSKNVVRDKFYLWDGDTPGNTANKPDFIIRNSIARSI